MINLFLSLFKCKKPVQLAAILKRAANLKILHGHPDILFTVSYSERLCKYFMLASKTEVFFFSYLLHYGAF